jgi:hypothetical protein
MDTFLLLPDVAWANLTMTHRLCVWTILFLLWKQCLSLTPAQNPRYNVADDIRKDGMERLSVALKQRQLLVAEAETSLSNVTSCSICGEYELQADFKPSYPDVEGIPSNLTCGDWQDVFNSLETSTQDCQDIRLLYLQCCEKGPPQYVCEQQIRTQFLQDYDAAVPPITSRQSQIIITVNLRYQTVTDIDVQSGEGEIFVWLYLSWVDPRLAWTQGPEGCSDVVSVRASLDVEKTEIWVPDFDLYNQVRGVQGFPDAMADVYSDGTVLWVRNGGLRAICQFIGLSQIPFDSLGCQFLFGAWNRLGTQPSPFGYVLQDGTGYEIGEFTPVYNEYQLQSDKTESGVTTGRFNNPIVWYTFYFHRAKRHYMVRMDDGCIMLLLLIVAGVFKCPHIY